MKLSVLSIAVLYSLLGSLHSIAVSVPLKMINVTSGGNAFLPCSFKTDQPTTKLNIQWSFVSQGTSQMIYYYQGGQYTIDPSYKGRVIVPASPNISMNASITITNVSPTDSGTYYCEVHNMPDVMGQTEGHVILNIFEKPSVPFCAIHGTVESGHFVTLTCHTEQGSPTPTYSWTKLEQDVSRSLRATVNAQTGVLQIGNLSQFEFGTYQCNASNIVGHATCTVNLEEELSNGVIAGAVIGALLASALIIFVVWYILHSLRKKQYKAVKAAAGTEMQVKSQTGNTANCDTVHGSEGNSQRTASTAPTEAAESQGQEEKEPVV